MARAATNADQNIPAEPDRLNAVPLPRERAELIGHAAAEQAFLHGYRSGHLHHAWLITGPQGIGKATFAFRAAKFLMRHGDPRLPAVERAIDLATDPALPEVHRVASGTHGQVLHMTRDWDHDRKRFKQDLTVETVRRANRFFASTASDGGWRIAIVDAADDMNPNSANALLKILEEPPPRSVFFVLAHVPGRLLPTIRSRCRVVALSPLMEADMQAALSGLLGDLPQSAALTNALTLAEGSVRSALVHLSGDGLKFVEQVDKLLRAPVADPTAAHVLADALGRGAGDGAFAVFQIRLRQVLGAQARALALSGDLNHAARLAEAANDIERQIARTEAFNLDRRQLVLSVLRTLAAARPRA